MTHPIVTTGGLQTVSTGHQTAAATFRFRQSCALRSAEPARLGNRGGPRRLARLTVHQVTASFRTSHFVLCLIFPLVAITAITSTVRDRAIQPPCFRCSQDELRGAFSSARLRQ